MSLLDFFKESTHEVSGRVDRIGPYHGDGDINGVIILLVGDVRPYIILRSTPPNEYPVGLTCAGDEVVMMATDKGRVVSAKEFCNKTLDERLNG